MTPERRQQIESMCLEALAMEPGSRGAFLEAACGPDDDLRREVESLLAGTKEAARFLDTPVWLTPAAPLASGTCLGPYVIEAWVGAGGMGEVYRAQDMRLGRTVAIKVLRPGIADDPDHRRRFEHEARAASALNHPNICTIYDVGDQDGLSFIAMEWIDGPRLDQAIATWGRVPIDRALTLARQIAAGMAAAHRAGIVHRDIKPANILLTLDGTLKIVDFGLVKTSVQAEDATATSVTREGAFMGTPGYASPEQVEGGALDARTDVFAIGCVLYELFSGRRAFGGDTPRAALRAVLVEVPVSLRSVRPDVPRTLEHIVGRALAKSPDARYSSALELLEDLDSAELALSARRVPVRAFLRRPLVGAALAVLITAGAVVGGLQWRQHAREEWVRGTAIPKVKALLEKGYESHFAAFRLLRQARALTPSDPQLRELMEEASITIDVSSTPEGADISVRDFHDGAEQWEYLGRTPLVARLPTSTMFLWKASRDGFLTQVLAGFSAVPGTDFRLVSADGAPEGMVYIPGGRQEFHDTSVSLEPFWIDRVEVTNRAFLAFVRGGGYTRGEFWLEAPRAIVSQFLDRTGRPGPATWSLGLSPEGRDDHPVGGVSWYEAAAYCRSVGKDLPTLHHWYNAASPGATTQWASLSNFQSDGTNPVGLPLHLNAFGTVRHGWKCPRVDAQRSHRGVPLRAGRQLQRAELYVRGFLGSAVAAARRESWIPLREVSERPACGPDRTGRASPS